MISVTEIVLIIAGFVALIVGYLLPVGHGDDAELLGITEREIQERVNRANEESRQRVEGLIDDSAEDGISRAERAMERLSNEKMSAISEYSDTVINEIHKSHEEVIFMYEMLNDKQQSLKSTVTEMTRTADEAKQAVQEAAKSAYTVPPAEKESRVVRPEPQAFETLRPEREEIVRPREETRVIRPVAAEDTEKSYTEPESSRTVTPSAAVRREDEASARFAAAGIQMVDLTRFDEAPVTEEESVRNSKVVPISEGARRRAEAADLYPDPMQQNRRILEMHHAGKSNMVIARELGLGIGEVKLVIDLSQKQQRRMAQ